ncbi:MAG TPA: hypothetical protein VKD22_08420 [Ramlibacter sp.]|nr:hypothetical protein [Ramlibacter sp.]
MDARGFFYVLIGGLFGASTVLFYFLVLTAQAPDPLRCMQQLECVDGKVHGTCGPAVLLEWWWFVPTMAMISVTLMVGTIQLSPMDPINTFFSQTHNQVLAGSVAALAFGAVVMSMWVINREHLILEFSMPYLMHVVFIAVGDLCIIVTKILPQRRLPIHQTP